MHSFQAVIPKAAHSRVGNLCDLKNKQTDDQIMCCVVQGSNPAMVMYDLSENITLHCLNNRYGVIRQHVVHLGFQIARSMLAIGTFQVGNLKESLNGRYS